MHDDDLHLITATSGKTFVGDWIGPFQPGHLVLVGPRLPHNWVSFDVPEGGVAERDLVIHFGIEFFEFSERAMVHREQGARFAKWRAVYKVSDTLPGRLAIEANAEMLARYAVTCQDEGVVPIAEPEVLMDGGHALERCAEVSEAVLLEVFVALHRHRVVLEHMLLKPNMVLAGNEQERQASVAEVAARTVCVLRRSVPAAVPGIFFLSGGQTPAEASAPVSMRSTGSGRSHGR